MNPLARMWGAITALAVGIAVSYVPQSNAAGAGSQIPASKQASVAATAAVQNPMPHSSKHEPTASSRNASAAKKRHMSAEAHPQGL